MLAGELPPLGAHGADISLGAGARNSVILNSVGVARGLRNPPCPLRSRRLPASVFSLGMGERQTWCCTGSGLRPQGAPWRGDSSGRTIARQLGVRQRRLGAHAQWTVCGKLELRPPHPASPWLADARGASGLLRTGDEKGRSHRLQKAV